MILHSCRHPLNQRTTAYLKLPDVIFYIFLLSIFIALFMIGFITFDMLCVA